MRPMQKDNNQKQNWSGHIYLYAPLFLWIAFIFVMSGNAGAFTETSRFIRPILEFLFPDASAETLRAMHLFIRKSAHFIEYAILALLTARTLQGGRAFQNRRAYRLLIIIAVVAAVASADEIGQSFRISRTGSTVDVLIDSIGGLAAALIAEFAIGKRSRAK